MPWKLYTLDHLSGGICVLNKTENVNLNVYIMITTEESKTLTKHMLCDCKCKFDDKKIIQIKSGTKICTDVSVKKQ